MIWSCWFWHLVYVRHMVFDSNLQFRPNDNTSKCIDALITALSIAMWTRTNVSALFSSAIVWVQVRQLRSKFYIIENCLPLRTRAFFCCCSNLNELPQSNGAAKINTKKKNKSLVPNTHFNSLRSVCFGFFFCAHSNHTCIKCSPIILFIKIWKEPHPRENVRTFTVNAIYALFGLRPPTTLRSINIFYSFHLHLFIYFIFF